MKNRRDVFLTGAVMAGLLGAVATLLIPRRGRKDWSQQTKDITDRILKEMRICRPNQEMGNKNFFLGGIIGSLVGVTTALLLAPKPGSQLMKELSRSFQPEKQKPKERPLNPIEAQTKVKRQAAASRTTHRSSAKTPTKHTNLPSTLHSDKHHPISHSTASHPVTTSHSSPKRASSKGKIKEPLSK